MWQLFSKEKSYIPLFDPWVQSLHQLEYNLINVWICNCRWGLGSPNTDQIGAIFYLLWCYVIFVILYCLNGIVDSLPFFLLSLHCLLHSNICWSFSNKANMWCLHSTCMQIHILARATCPVCILFQWPRVWPWWSLELPTIDDVGFA